jgi:hypothetical protein
MQVGAHGRLERRRDASVVFALDDAVLRSDVVPGAIAADFVRDGYVRLDVASYGWTLLVHRSTSGPPYRVTRFDSTTLEPLGHTEHETIEGAAREAFELVGYAKEMRERYRTE